MQRELRYLPITFLVIVRRRAQLAVGGALMHPEEKYEKKRIQLAGFLATPGFVLWIEAPATRSFNGSSRFDIIPNT